MNMKRIGCYVVGLLIVCGLQGLWSGCTEDAPALSEVGETSTLRLNVPTLEVGRSVGTDVENAIHSLWVLICGENGDVIHNGKYVGTSLPSDNVIVINDVPVGTVEIYVVANEESIGKNYSDLQSWQDDIVESQDGRKVVVKDEKREYFPLKGVPDFENSQWGLPMSWAGKVEIVLQTDGNPQEVAVELKRMVSKINLTISHNYSESIEINEISFGKFFGDRLYLFQVGTQLAIPSDVQYEAKVYEGLHVELPAQTETRTLSLYVYPSFSWEAEKPSNYTLGFTTTVGGTECMYPAKALIAADGSELGQLLRNTILDVNVRLSDTNVEFDFKARPWTEEEAFDVPPFN